MSSPSLGEEEIAKAARMNEPSETTGTIPKPSENYQGKGSADSETDVARARELEKEIMDLRITNRGKDFFIDQLQSERDRFFLEAMMANRKSGELETNLLQLAPPQYGGPAA